MVLSLPFILAFIGSAVGLIIGMVIYGDISEAIECPASGGSPILVSNVTSYDNLGTLGTAGDATYYESEVLVDFLPSVTGKINEAVVQEGTSSLDANGEIYLGSTPSDWWFLSGGNVGSNLTSISFWINGDVVGNAEYPLLSNFEVGTETDGIIIRTESGRLRVAEENDGFLNLNTRFRGPGLDSEPPDDSQWHLLTITYDKGITSGLTNMEYCLDGTVDNLSTVGTKEGCFSGNEIANNAAVGEDCPSSPIANPDSGQCYQQGGTFTTWTGSSSPPNDILVIGSDGDHNAVCSGGSCTVENTFMIDDLAIWNGYILTPTDIDNLWNGGSGASVSSVGISPGTRVGYWSFDDSTANGVITGGGGGEGGVGSEQCQQAKDISWTVIGIIPVALFFSLFAIFSALGTGRQ